MFTGMKAFAAHIHNIFYVSVEFSHSYQSETNQSVSVKETAAAMVAEIHDRTGQFLAMYDWMDFAFSFFFLVVLYK
jgi:cell division protein FtsI/penicillin-binding protein 2